MALLLREGSVAPVTVAAVLHEVYAGPGLVLLIGVIEEERLGHVYYDFFINDGAGHLPVRHCRVWDTPLDIGRLVDAVGRRRAVAYWGRVSWLGRYVVIAGRISSAGETHICAEQLRLVRTADEVSFHLIEVAWAYLHAQRARSTFA